MSVPAITGPLRDAMNRQDSNPPPKNTSAAASVDETEVVSEVERLYRSAQTRRMQLQLEWARNIAYLEGRHWLRIDPGARRLAPTDPLDDVLYAHTINIIERVCKTVVNLSSQNKPDAEALPESDLEIDDMAADEADAALAYADQRFAPHRLRKRAIRWALATGGGWRTAWWDEHETAEMQVPDQQTPEGVIPAYVESNALIGNVCAEIVPTFELFIDPGADCWERARWVIRETVRDPNWCRERWPKKAEEISPDARGIDSMLGYTQAFMLDYRPDEQLKNGVRVLELWEKPSPKFRQGRYIVVAGKRVMEHGPNKYHDRPGSKCLPFVPTYHEDAIGHAYGIPLINALIDPQDEYNRLWSKGLSRIESAKSYIAVPESAGASPKSIHSTRENEVITWDPMGGVSQPPYQVIPPPPMSGEIIAMCGALEAQIEKLAGVINLVGEGGKPPDLSGLAIDLLQQQGNTIHDGLRENLEQAEAELGDWIVYLFGKFAGPVPRLMGLDSKNNPEDQQGGARTLTALQNGGSCRVRVTPGSATARTPAALRAFILELQSRGLFGPFQDPSQVRSAIMVAQALNDVASNKILRNLEDELERMEAEQSAQQAQEQQMMMLQMAQQQGQAQAAQPDPAQEFAMKQADAQTQADAREHQADLDVQKEFASRILDHELPPPQQGGKPTGGSSNGKRR